MVQSTSIPWSTSTILEIGDEEVRGYYCLFYLAIFWGQILYRCNVMQSTVTRVIKALAWVFFFLFAQNHLLDIMNFNKGLYMMSCEGFYIIPDFYHGRVHTDQLIWYSVMRHIFIFNSYLLSISKPNPRSEPKRKMLSNLSINIVKGSSISVFIVININI